MCSLGYYTLLDRKTVTLRSLKLADSSPVSALHIVDPQPTYCKEGLFLRKICITDQCGGNHVAIAECGCTTAYIAGYTSQLGDPQSISLRPEYMPD